MRPRTILALISLGLLASGGTPHVAAGPAVALLASTGAEPTTTSLYVIRPDQATAGAPVATFTHAAGAVVRGSVLTGTQTVVAVADTRPDRDPSFAASLFRLASHAPPVMLCEGVVHASRPLVTASGLVLVSRGVAGVDPPRDGALRVDDLTVDAIDLDTGAARAVHAFTGYLTFLAGALKDEVVLYRVGPSGADLVAVDTASGGIRVLLPSLPPYARDFSLDAERGALWFQDRHETDTRTWVVDRLDLASGARTRVHVGASVNIAPHAWPGGGVALNPDGRSGLALLGAPIEVSHPLGEGVDVGVARSADGSRLALLHTRPSSLPVPFVLDTATGEAALVPTPVGARVAIAGFVAATGDAP